MSYGKEYFDKIGYPDPLASDEEKATEAYGLQVGKQIEFEWFNRTESDSASYYEKRDKYHNLRLYGRGEQDMSVYKDLLNGGSDVSYTNYDWRPIQVVPKFVKLIVNQMTERLFDVKAEAIDSFSVTEKEKVKDRLEKDVIRKPLDAEMKAQYGIDLSKPTDSLTDTPETFEEVDLYMKMNYKASVEIATEEALKYTLSLNDYDEVQSRVIQDVTEIGLSCVKHSTDINQGIKVEWVDPARLVYSYPIHKDFKDVHYYGEVKRMTILELKRITGDRFKDEELKDIAKATSEWVRYQGSNASEDHYRDDDLNGFMIDVMFFNYKSTNNISYKKKYQKNGGYKMTKKESTFSKTNDEYKGYDVEKKRIDVWYEGGLILGTNKLFNYKLCENMIRPKGDLNRTYPNYIMYAPDLYQNRTKSLVETVVPYVDQMQQIHIKIQQLIAKARPNGIYIDVAGLNEVSMGDGNVLEPLEAVKIYDETGNVLGSSVTQEGEYNYGREPIKELKNGVTDGIDRLIGAYNHYLNLLRDSIGIPQGADASTPHPDTAVGVQNQVALNSNTATRHILDSGLNISERLSKALILRLSDIFEYSNLKSAYTNAIGKENIKVIESLNKLHLHDLGISIELKPDAQERQFLEANINQALSKESITLDDAIDIRNIDNTKLAKEVLKIRRKKKEKDEKSFQKEMETTRAEGQAMIAERAGKATMEAEKFKTQSEIAVVRAKSEAKTHEIKMEEEAKARLMEKEFQYNMQIKGIETQGMQSKEKYKEDRKDSRQDKGNTQDSKKIEQRQFNTPAINFESSNDNLSGGIEMGGLEPS